jgi:hypothetical protein
MQSNPTFNNAIWNPVAHWQLGQTNDGTAVVIVTFVGETGEETSIQFPNPEYFAGLASELGEAADFFFRVQDEGFNSVASEIESKSDPTVPDDISNLFDKGVQMSIDIDIDIDTSHPVANAFSTYTDHLLAQQASNPGLFLGMLVWYTVPESVWVDYSQFTSQCMQLNAPVEIRKAPKASDVFLRACTTVEGNYKKRPVSTYAVNQSNAAYSNYLIRKAGSDADWICKQVVVEYVDLSDHQLSFEVLGDIRFHKNTHQMICQPTGIGYADDTFTTITDDIRSYYKKREMLLTPYTIREAFRRALEGPMMALSVRTAGGVYYVNSQQGENLSAVERLASQIEGMTLHILPLIDDSSQREMLKAAFEDDSVGELQRLMGDINDVIDTKGSLTTKQLVAFQERYDEYRKRTREYSDILDDSLDTASASLLLCKETIKSAFSKVSD